MLLLKRRNFNCHKKSVLKFMLARNVTCVKKLYVHENKIIEAHEVKYLRDFIHENGRPN